MPRSRPPVSVGPLRDHPTFPVERLVRPSPSRNSMRHSEQMRHTLEKLASSKDRRDHETKHGPIKSPSMTSQSINELFPVGEKCGPTGKQCIKVDESMRPLLCARRAGKKRNDCGCANADPGPGLRIDYAKPSAHRSPPPPRFKFIRFFLVRATARSVMPGNHRARGCV